MAITLLNPSRTGAKLVESNVALKQLKKIVKANPEEKWLTKQIAAAILKRVIMTGRMSDNMWGLISHMITQGDIPEQVDLIRTQNNLTAETWAQKAVMDMITPKEKEISRVTPWKDIRKEDGLAEGEWQWMVEIDLHQKIGWNWTRQWYWFVGAAIAATLFYYREPLARALTERGNGNPETQLIPIEEVIPLAEELAMCTSNLTNSTAERKV